MKENNIQVLLFMAVLLSDVTYSSQKKESNLAYLYKGTSMFIFN